jgi:hypothetical protein
MTRKEAIAKMVAERNIKEIARMTTHMRFGEVHHTYANIREVFMRCAPGLDAADFDALMYEVDNFESQSTRRAEGSFPR